MARVVHEIMLVVSGLVLLSGSLYVVPSLGEYLEKAAKALGAFQGVIGIAAIVVALLNIASLAGIVLLLAGIVLAAGILGTLPSVGESFKRIAKFLGGFQVALGAIALLLGLLLLVGAVL